MAETLTVNYGWTKPDPGASPNTWGSSLNSDLDKIDAQVFVNQQAIAAGGSNVGDVKMFAGATPPTNWMLCNGAAISRATYATLFGVIGVAFGAGDGSTTFNLPNLTNRVPLGAGPNPLGTLGGGGAGGTFAYTIATANLPSHAHPIVDVAHTHGASQPAHVHPDPGHAHSASASQPAHNHTVSGTIVAGGGLTPGGAADSIGTTTTSSAQPGISVTVNAAATNLQPAQPAITVNASGTNLSTTAAVGSGTPLSVVPPFNAINFVIRYQ